MKHESSEATPAAGLRFAPARSAADVQRLATLAREIWYEYYVPLIGLAQVDYMVAKFQSATAMQEQIATGYEYFMIRRADELVGYCAVQSNPAERSLFISKLYLRREQRGGGSGRHVLQFIEQLARERSACLLWLTVNKGNVAVKAYERWGFQIAASIRIDIGEGFVMDDFRMEKYLPSVASGT
jgi:diamine N-acetyltransferase